MNENDEIVQEFIVESRDMIDETEPLLIELNNLSDATGTVDSDTLNTIFRTFHSIKGTAGFMDFNSISRVTHEAETLLDLFRKGKARMGKHHTQILCSACDFIRDALTEVEQTGSDESTGARADALVAELTGVMGMESEEAQEAPVPEGDAPAGDAPAGDEPLITDDLRERFIMESDDLMDDMEQNLLQLEKSPLNPQDLVNDAFRSIHSFKGNCGFMGFPDLEKLSHAMETVLDSIKDGSCPCTEEILARVLKTVDVLRTGVADLANGGSGTIPDLEQHCASLNRLLNAEAPDTAEEEAPKTEAEAPSAEAEEPEEEEDDSKSGPTPSKTSSTKKITRRDIRVDLDKLDLLIDLVGELVIAEAMVTHNPDLKGYEFELFEKAASHLNRIVRDLQDVAMSVRMIPISGTFRKMFRLIHDLSLKAGKKVKINVKGEETEIDKTVAELIADPLVHIIRNAVDHGMEPPDDREAAGKEPTGTIDLEARHEGGEVWIIIRDDGRGINKEKVLAKAVERGLVKNTNNELTDSEVFRMIFEPGFSTAAAITDISGRGVGLDVVKKNIERLKGTVDVQSVEGEGTLIILRIPLTLAIIEGMLIRVGTAKYTLPIISVKESIRVRPEQVTTTMDGQEIVRVREDLIPVIRLSELHATVPDHQDLCEGILIVMENQNKKVGVFVDEILGQHQTVIKGLSNFLGTVRSVSGCTILGDGDISLILDPSGIVNLAENKAQEQELAAACIGSV